MKNAQNLKFRDFLLRPSIFHFLFGFCICFVVIFVVVGWFVIINCYSLHIGPISKDMAHRNKKKKKKIKKQRRKLKSPKTSGQVSINSKLQIICNWRNYCIDILMPCRDGDRKIIKTISVTRRSPKRIRQCKQVQSIIMNIHQRNTYSKDFSWLHLDTKPRIQEAQQV